MENEPKPEPRKRKRERKLCPTCHTTVLTAFEVSRGYQCPYCTRADEGGF